MTGLRWILLGVGILIIAGIYVWGRQRSVARRRQMFEEDENFDSELLNNIEIDRDDVDLGGAVNELDDLIADKFSEDSNTDQMGAFSAKADDSQMDFGEQEISRKGSDSNLYQADDTAVPQGNELILVLNVMSEPGKTFNGTAIFDAIEKVDLVYGDMHIFHHYGIGDMSTQQPAFSMANIIEPGVFSEEDKSELETPGLCLFLRIPGPMDGLVAFELMLNTGRRLAELLGGDLRDDTRSVVTLQTVSHIRDQIVEFNRQQLVSS